MGLPGCVLSPSIWSPPFSPLAIPPSQLVGMARKLVEAEGGRREGGGRWGRGKSLSFDTPLATTAFYGSLRLAKTKEEDIQRDVDEESGPWRMPRREKVGGRVCEEGRKQRSVPLSFHGRKRGKVLLFRLRLGHLPAHLPTRAGEGGESSLRPSLPPPTALHCCVCHRLRWACG